MGDLSGAGADPADGATALRVGQEAERLEMLRAVVDVIAPGVDGHPPASALDVHVRVAESLEMLQRGATTLLGRLLNMYARAEQDRASFLDLDAAGRDRVLRALAADELDEIRDLVEGVHAFTLNGYLAGRVAGATGAPPAVWDAMGFRGPARGHLDLVARHAAVRPPAARADA